MKKLGMGEDVVMLIKSYLTDRKLFVQIEDKKSTTQRCPNIGCPQGSVVGPLLYLIYTTCIPNLLKREKHILFADDTAVVIETEADPTTEVANILERAHSHFNRIRLKLNVAKTEVLTNNNNKFKIDVNNNSLITKTRCESARYLGIMINADLNWNEHCEQVLNKMRKGLFALNKLRKTRTNPNIIKIKKAVMDALVTSHFNYCNGSWNISLNETLMRRFRTLHKAAIRSVFNAKFDAHTKPLFKEAKSLELDKIIKKGVLSQYLSLKNGILSEYAQQNAGVTRRKGYLEPKLKSKILRKQLKVLNEQHELLSLCLAKQTTLKHFTEQALASMENP